MRPIAACHSVVTPERLRTIERAGGVLADMGLRGCRVGHHDDLTRVEVGPDEMVLAFDPAVGGAPVRELKAVGCCLITLDLQSYRLDSLNDGVRLRPI